MDLTDPALDKAGLACCSSVEKFLLRNEEVFIKMEDLIFFKPFAGSAEIS